jgi:hypothetical protein
MPKESFGTIDNRIRSKYGHLIDFDSPRYQSLMCDSIEVWEDMERLHPLLTEIVHARLDDKAFQAAMREIFTWSWHISDHCNSLHEADMAVD